MRRIKIYTMFFFTEELINFSLVLLFIVLNMKAIKIYLAKTTLYFNYYFLKIFYLVLSIFWRILNGFSFLFSLPINFRLIFTPQMMIAHHFSQFFFLFWLLHIQWFWICVHWNYCASKEQANLNTTMDDV